MKTGYSVMSGAAMIVGVVGLAAGADCAATGCSADHAAVPDALVHPSDLAQREIARRLLPLLPAEDRRAIIAAGGVGSEGMGHVHGPACMGLPSDITPTQFMAKIISKELGERMTDIQWQMVRGVVATLERGESPPALCFHPDTDPEYAYAINQLIEFPLTIRFQQTNRWSRTAVSGTGLTQGTPTTITYSFVPDGTVVPDLIGVSGNSNLFAWLNGIYGSPATWQPLFDQVFDRWSQLIGTTYVFEPNDDGARLNLTNSSGWGISGVRGDVRIAAIPIDGNSGTLAYNNFPNDGDMVFDSADSFYNNTGSNSLRFRNVIAHEHGHGLGMLHVCPANQTKLMEPFVSTAYNGPQLDDILNGHRHYGDPLEPLTDNPATAPLLGVFGLGGVFTQTNVSIDGVNDQDFFRVTVTQPSQLQVTVIPDAATYLQGTQTQACNTGTNTNYNAIRDLRLDIYLTANPFSPLATADDSGVGGSEIVMLDITQPGDYLIRVSASGTDNVQRYALTGFLAQLPFQGPLISAELPAALEPGVATVIPVTIDPQDDQLVGTPSLFYRFDGGAFQSAPLASLGGTSYTATLPAADCGEVPQFYLSTQGQTIGAVTLPAAGAGNPATAIVGEIVMVFADNFETDTGWVVSGPATNASQGRWQRGVPGGDGSRGDPATDFDGSGQCYVTGNGGPGSNTDVDAGSTILTSPVFNATAVSDATLTYARWYDNTGSGTGAAPGADTFKIFISNNNGASYIPLETVGPNTAQSSGGWFEVSFRIADVISPTSQMRVQFLADDLGSGSVIEAGVDAFRVSGVTCEDPGPSGCSAADLAEPFGVINFFDLSTYLTLYNAGDPAADLAAPFGVLNFFDLSQYLSVYNAGCP
jgi:hypothetical protein